MSSRVLAFQVCLCVVSSWLLGVCSSATLVHAQQSAELKGSSFDGSWAFELPDGNPAWLGVVSSQKGLQASLLWSVGSARPVKILKSENNLLHIERNIRWQPFGNPQRAKVIQRPMVLKLENGVLTLTAWQASVEHPEELEELVLRGKKIPPIPVKPDLTQVQFGPPIDLFDGHSLKGWKLSNPSKKNGWRAEAGVLINETPKKDFGAYGEYGNLVTDDVFEDFRLRLDYRVAEGGNSGVYLRGMYEAQVVDRDSSMQGISGPGAIFGRIAPSENAGKAGGQWNSYELTLVDRHVSVQLNGKLVIDNQPLVGCTGGGLSADDTQPGPILLQGDHTSVEYRKIVLEPVLKD